MQKKLSVMVPVDFTPVSFRAIEFLGFLMDKTPIETHLVHVIQEKHDKCAGVLESLATEQTQEDEALEEHARQQFILLKQYVDFSFKATILRGDFACMLHQYAVQNSLDLIIAASEGDRSWGAAVFGSPLHYLLDTVKVPVITVSPKALATSLHRILWVADFTIENHPEPIIRTLAMLQQLYGVPLHLLQLIEKAENLKSKELHQKVERFAATIGLQQYQLHLNGMASLSENEQHFDSDHQMDLLVLGMEDKKSFGLLMNDSIAEILDNHFPQPLFTYHLI